MRGLRSEKNMVTAVGRGFDSRHLHHLRGGVSLLVARTYVCRVRRTLAPPRLFVIVLGSWSRVS